MYIYITSFLLSFFLVIETMEYTSMFMYICLESNCTSHSTVVSFPATKGGGGLSYLNFLFSISLFHDSTYTSLIVCVDPFLPLPYFT